MEERLVFPVRAGPDATLAGLRAELEARGFRVRIGRSYDLVGRRGLDRVFIGIGPDPRGLAARVKAKSLVPGRARRLLSEAGALVTSRLGVAFERSSTPGVRR